MAINQFVQYCAQQFQNLADIWAGDQAVGDAVQRYPSNTTKWHVYQKVALVTTLYKTPIYNSRKLANHIFEHGEQLDRYLGDGNSQAVSIIRQGHEIQTRNGKEWDFFSFATKYACWHRPNHFPIYDKLVASLLVKLNSREQFREGRLCRAHFNTKTGYDCFRAALDSCCTHFQLADDTKYKRLDQGLWVWAKCIYDPTALAETLAPVQQKFADLVTPHVDETGTWWD